MDFVVGLPSIVGSYDTILVNVKRLTESTCFIPFWVKYTAEILS